MTWQTWWLFTFTTLVLDLTPGPAVLYVLSSALRAGAVRSVFAAAGILSANAFYFLLSALGLGALLASAYNLFFWIKWLGAAYLFYLGVRAFVGAHAIVPKPGDSGGERGGRKLWSSGVLLQLSNPKAIILFSAILPQFVDPHRPMGTQLGILGVTEIVGEFVVLSGYGILAGRAAEWARQPRYALWTNRVAGLMLMTAAVFMALLRRN